MSSRLRPPSIGTCGTSGVATRRASPAAGAQVVRRASHQPLAAPTSAMRSVRPASSSGVRSAAVTGVGCHTSRVRRRPPGRHRASRPWHGAAARIDAPATGSLAIHRARSMAPAERDHVVGWDGQPGHAILDRFGQATRRRGDDDGARRHGLEGDQTERFAVDRRHDDDLLPRAWPLRRHRGRGRRACPDRARAGRRGRPAAPLRDRRR